jgi:hypothetical protein
MATTNAGAFNVARAELTLNADSSAIVVLSYTSVATGAIVVRRILTIPADHTKAITDQNGAVVAASVPAGLATTLDNIATNLDTTISNGATGNKLNL